MWGALSDERTGLSFTTAAGPSQRSHSLVRAPLESRPYFTVSDLRLPISSPPTTLLAASGLVLYSHCTDNVENTVLLLRRADHIDNTSHVMAISPVHWRVDCCLATNYKHSSYCCVRVSWGDYRAVAWQYFDMSHY
jgi:hypothetical protein